MSTRQPARPVVRVQIERLVLDGVPGFERSGDRGRLRDAVTAALSEQLRRHPRRRVDTSLSIDSPAESVMLEL